MQQILTKCSFFLPSNQKQHFNRYLATLTGVFPFIPPPLSPPPPPLQARPLEPSFEGRWRSSNTCGTCGRIWRRRRRRRRRRRSLDFFGVSCRRRSGGWCWRLFGDISWLRFGCLYSCTVRVADEVLIFFTKEKECL